MILMLMGTNGKEFMGPNLPAADGKEMASPVWSIDCT